MEMFARHCDLQNWHAGGSGQVDVELPVGTKEDRTLEERKMRGTDEVRKCPAEKGGQPQ